MRLSWAAGSAVAVGLWLLSATSASAQGYHTDFPCSPPPAHNPLATAICHNKDAASTEFLFSRVYYALRNQVGAAGTASLKAEVIADDKTIDSQCGIPEPGQSDAPLNGEQIACYVSKQDIITEKYSGRLNDMGALEAGRDIDQHIAIQKQLIALGYLKGSAPPDGVYGDATRAAINAWKRNKGIFPLDGFLAVEDASTLMQDEPAPSAGSGIDAGMDKNAEAVAANIMSQILQSGSDTAQAFHQPDPFAGMSRALAEKEAGNTAGHPMTGTALIVAILFVILILFAVFFYFLPIFISQQRGVEKKSLIVIVNLFFGWTILGWFAALIMACTYEQERPSSAPFRI